MIDITGNGSLLEGKPRESITLREIVDSINSIIQTDLIDPVEDIEKQSSVLTATGIWLDYIGERLKYPRPTVVVEKVLWFGFDGFGFGFDQSPFKPDVQDSTEAVGIDDDAYRALLIVRGGQLLTDCSIPSMDKTLQGAFGVGHYIDNGNMSIDVILDNSVSDVVLATIAGTDIITKPAGVLINEIYILNNEGTFGFDGNGVGFDQGTFVRTFSELLESIIEPTYLIDDAGNNLTDNVGNFLIV